MEAVSHGCEPKRVKMAFNDIEHQRTKNQIGAFVESVRPPVSIRDEFDISYSISGQSIEIEEVRPVWRGEPGETTVLAMVKITFIRKRTPGVFTGCALACSGRC